MDAAQRTVVSEVLPEFAAELVMAIRHVEVIDRPEIKQVIDTFPVEKHRGA